MKSVLDDIAKLKEAVLTSTSGAETLRKFGLTPTVTNFKRLMDRVACERIGVSHFVRGGIPPKWRKENLASIVASSDCYATALRMLNLTPTGSNPATLKKYISKYGLDVSHFNGKHLRKNLGGHPALTAEQIFVEHSTTRRVVVRTHLLKHKVLPYVCSNCCIDATWNDQPLTLQLEHKNGVNDDNRISNLEFLCPNCHSQTLTFAGRNKNKRG